MNCEEYKKYCIELAEANEETKFQETKSRIKCRFPNFDVLVTKKQNKLIASICDYEFDIDDSYKNLIFFEPVRKFNYISVGWIFDEITLGRFFAANPSPKHLVKIEKKLPWWKFWQ